MALGMFSETAIMRSALRYCGYLFLISSPAFAGDTPQIPIAKVIEDGGTVMKVLIAMAALATFMVIYYLLSLRLNVLLPPSFLVEAEDLAESGDVNALAAACAENGSPGACIVGAAARLLRDSPEADYTMLRDVIEDEGSRQSSRLWQRIQYLMDIAVVAPMVGLLGTVLGMMRAFVGLAEDFQSVQPIQLSAGVSQALVTTAAGMFVGIVTMILFAYFRGRVNGLVTKLEERCNHVLASLMRGRSAETTK